MVKRNSHFSNLSVRYLFPDIQRRKQEFLTQNPEAKIISLGIGDTPEPVPKVIAQGLSLKCHELTQAASFTGYGSEQGDWQLREQIAKTFYSPFQLHAADVFVSDGTKCDLGRLQQLFGADVSIAIQDPSYPVYIDGSVIAGVKKITYLSCTPDQLFFPCFSQLPPVDLIYFCSPNNPTGAAATKEQLQELVNYARRNKAIIIYDAAYAYYIQDPALPRSIYEIAGAEEVAIELGSFSKLASFTGVRLGWAIVPAVLKYEDGRSIQPDWIRLTSTIFNAASNIAQRGGLMALSPAGLLEIQRLTQSYLENASLLKICLEGKGLPVYGGINCPYLWVHFKGKKSWDIFSMLLEKIHLITTPGVGFGPAGEGYIRFSAFSTRKDLLEAISRINSSDCLDCL